MKRLLLLAGIAALLGGCSTLNSLPGTGTSAQQVNIMLTVMQTISSFSANGCIPPITATDPAIACAPITATDQTSINNAVNACLTATAVQLVLSNVKVPRCQVVPSPPPTVVVVPPTPPPAPTVPTPIVIPAPR